jgi:hypothetical protein
MMGKAREATEQLTRDASFARIARDELRKISELAALLNPGNPTGPIRAWLEAYERARSAPRGKCGVVKYPEGHSCEAVDRHDGEHFARTILGRFTWGAQVSDNATESVAIPESVSALIHV